MSFSCRFIKHRVPHDLGDTVLYEGPAVRIPLTGERVILNTSRGYRTYKVSRITNDLHRAVYTLELTEVESVYVD